MHVRTVDDINSDGLWFTRNKMKLTINFIHHHHIYANNFDPVFDVTVFEMK